MRPLPTRIGNTTALQRWIGIACLVAASSLSIGCASQSYMGISLVPGRSLPDLEALAVRAQAGDKQAQLDLGVRFEEGRGIKKDYHNARRLYRRAARGSGGALWIYSPPVASGTHGRIMQVNAGRRQAGLLEAKSRLEALSE